MTSQKSGFNPERIQATGGGVVPVAGKTDTSKADKLDSDIEALKQSFATEEELLFQKFENEQKLLGEFYAGKEELTQEWYDLSLESKQRYESKLTEIQQREAKARLQAYQGALGNLSTLMNTESRKLFEIGKVAAYANAVLSGHEAAVSSYAAGARIGGPPLGAAFAAASIAATGVQIAAIRATSFGGGSSGGGASATSAINAASEPVRGQGQTQPTQNINIHGIDPSQMFTGQQMIDLLNNEIINGGRINVHG
jgi:hypothetical protein